MKTQTTLAIMLAAGIFAAPLNADVIELTNGDRLTAHVVSQTDQAVTINHPVLGELVLPAKQVKGITKDIAKPTGASEPQAEQEPSATVKPKPAVEGAAQVPQIEPPTTLEDVDKIIEDQNDDNAFSRMLENWDSKLELGLNGSGGDTETQNVYLRLATKKQEGRNRWLVGAQYFLGRSSGKRTRHQGEVKVTRDWLQKDSPWFLFARGEYKYDQFRSWEHRASAYGGGGYTFIDDGPFELVGRAGLGGTYQFGEVQEWTPEAIFSGSLAKWNINERQLIAGELTYYPSLEAIKDYRIQGKIWWQYKLNFLDGMSLKIGAEDEYNATPEQGDEEHDFKYYGAMVLEF